MKLKRFLLALLLAIVPAIALADLEARQGADIARLLEKPCTNPVVTAHIPEADLKHFSEASVLFSGQSYAACWVRLPNGAAYLVYEDGDKGTVPASHIKPVLEL